jgi:hypothetical protein
MTTLDPHNRDDGEKVDALLTALRPQAPAGLSVKVMAAVEERRARRRFLGFVLGGGVALAAAAAAAMLVVQYHHRPGSPIAEGTAWHLASPSSAVPQAGGGEALADGVTITPDEGAPVILYDDHGGHVSIDAYAQAIAHSDGLWLEAGAAELDGDGTQLLSSIAQVTALGVTSQVAVEIYGDAGAAPGQATPTPDGAPAALLSVSVEHGSARIERPGVAGAMVLGEGDRTLIGKDAPAVTMRAHPEEDQPVANRDGYRPQQVPNRDGFRSPASQGIAASSQPAEEGQLDKDIIRRVIRYNLPVIQGCYEKALTTNPSLGGTIVFNFTIAPHGDAAGVEDLEVVPPAEGEPTMPIELQQCLLGAISQMQFPTPEGGGVVHVTYPFAFKAGGAPGSLPALPTPRGGADAIELEVKDADLYNLFDLLAQAAQVDVIIDPSVPHVAITDFTADQIPATQAIDALATQARVHATWTSPTSVTITP